MRKWLLFMMILFTMGCAEKIIPQSDVTRMTKEDLRNRLGSPDLVLIDVRYGKDWTESNQKITGAVREDPQAIEKWTGKYPKDKTLVLYCA